MGGLGSGRKPHSMTVMEVVAALHRLTPLAMQVIEDALKTGDVRVAQAVIEHVKGRPAQAVTGADGKAHEIILRVVYDTPEEKEKS